MNAQLPFYGLLAMVLVETVRRFVVVPGVGELGTAVGIFTLAAVGLRAVRLPSILNSGFQSAVWKPVLLFVCVGAVSVTVATHIGVAFQEWMRLATRFVPFFFVITTQLNSMKRFRIFSWCFMITGVYWSVECFFRFRFFLEGTTSFSFAVGRGTAESIVSMVIPIALGLMWRERRSMSRRLLIFLLLLFSFSVGIASARAAILSFAVVIVYVGYRRYRLSPRVFIFAILLFVAVTAFLPKSYIDLRYGVLAKQQAHARTVSVRLNMWYAGLAVIRDHPILGIGFGQVPFVLPNYGREYRLEGYGTRKTISRLHQAYLDVALQMGLVGLGSYLLVLFACFFSYEKTFRIARRIGNSEIQWFAFALQAGLLAECVQGFFGKAWDSDSLWFLLGMSAALASIVKRNVKEMNSRRGMNPESKLYNTGEMTRYSPIR